jgi:SmpA / OmlA family
MPWQPTPRRDNARMRAAQSVLAATVATALITMTPARAAAPDNAALQQEIQALKATVLDLQARMSQLEGHAVDAQPPPQSAAVDAQPAPVPQAAPAEVSAVVPAGSTSISPEAALKLNWSKVGPGMDQNQVAQLLGAPSAKSTLDGRPVWYYAYPGTGRGSVFFTDAGKVSSRQSPFGLGW